MSELLFPIQGKTEEKHTRAFLPSPFIVAALPTRDVKNLPFTRKYNDITLSLSGQDHIPYGKYGRLLLTIFTTHAVLNKNNSNDCVKISYKSINQLLKELQLPSSRVNEIKDQLNYFSSSTFVFREEKTKIVKKRLFRDLFDDIETVEGEVKATGVSTGVIPFFSSMKYIDIEEEGKQKQSVAIDIILSPQFTTYSQKHSVPIDYTIYKDISSPIGKDIYAWIVYRNNSLTEPLFISRTALVEQFMPVINSNDEAHQERTNFDYIKDQILNIKQKYCPELNVTFEAEGQGITLRKSNLPEMKDNSHYVLITSTL